MNIFWVCFHSIMFAVLIVIWTFSEITRDVKEIRNNEKHSNNKKEHFIGETIIRIVIMLVVFFTILYFIFNIIAKNQIGIAWFCGVYGIIYGSIAIKQVVKMIFIPEKSAFSFSDIKNITYTYMFWWSTLFVVSSTESMVGILEKIPSAYEDVVEVGMLLLWYYFNILFALWGVYILLYYLWETCKYVQIKFYFKNGKIKNIVNRISDLWQRREKYVGLRSFRLWKENNGKRVSYKIFMTLPLLMFDICRVTYLFAKIFAGMTFAVVIMSIFDPLKAVCKYSQNIWNRYKNNEWMYLFAQIAGLFSYVIVFLMIQYGEYEGTTQKIYEFAGTIILIPYFISKIVSVNKNLKEDEV